MVARVVQEGWGDPTGVVSYGLPLALRLELEVRSITRALSADGFPTPDRRSSGPRNC